MHHVDLMLLSAGLCTAPLQEKLRRAEALASEREALTNHLRRTLEQQDLRVKQVRVSQRMIAAAASAALPVLQLNAISPACPEGPVHDCMAAGCPATPAGV
jgi:hypothetical protein